ncbi:uncharacterized protein L201_000834 [Kwoniella dendrophila CBS 6074]|uniref:Uncharacterized protein n=1 Tax=Kwoniella dendrophila CBS 6074 TaxID=1295534 RepID=A0AAX4JKP3_9TREE
MPLVCSSSYPSLSLPHFQPSSALPSPIMSPESTTPSLSTMSSNMGMNNMTSTPKPLPKSTSQPTLTKSSSNSSLNGHMTSPTKTPSSSSKNYHPYLIHSSASSLLTRTNSSPAQPPTSPSNHHRSSRSMSSLNYILEGGGHSEKEKEDRRKSMESQSPSSPNKHGNRRPPMVKRSGTLPEFLNNAGKSSLKDTKEIDLPLNPKLWTPSELAQYLGYTLRTGGTEGTGQILPAPLVEDIKSWVLRQRVSGRDFLKGSSDGWGNTTRPPPFLPLLQTIARRLRRHSLSGRIESVPANPDDSFGRGSVLLEENEDEEDQDEDDITGVKKMANAFDARSSGSSVSEAGASGDEQEVVKLKPQWTGESIGERWKAWEERFDGDRRHRYRKFSDVSIGSASDLESLIGHQTGYQALLKSEDEEEDQEQVATIKAPPPVNLDNSPSISLPEGLTPPPPYTSTFTSSDPIQAQSLTSVTENLTPERRNDGEFSATPTPERTMNNAGLGILESSPDHTPSRSSSTRTQQNEETGSPHMKNMSSHSVRGSDPYAALRKRSSSGAKPKYPSVRNLNLNNDDEGDEEEEEEEGYLRPAQKSPANANFQGEELEGSRWTTARRVTLKPTKAQNIFDSSVPTTPTTTITNMQEEKDQKMEEQMSFLLNRIKELENKLDDVTKTNKNNVDKLNKQGNRNNNSKSVLDLIGLGPKYNDAPDGDGLPRTVRELPVYLFLVGFGVGAVMCRVLFGRSR